MLFFFFFVLSQESIAKIAGFILTAHTGKNEKEYF